MSADLCFTGDSFFFLLIFRRLISELAELNSTKINLMLGNNCDLKTLVQNLGYSLPTNWGPKTTFFGRLHNLMANLTAYIFGTKHGIDNQSSALTTTRDLLYRPKMSWTLVHKRLQTRPAFYLTSVNTAFHFIVRLRRRRSANGTLPNFAKWQTVGRANNLL